MSRAKRQQWDSTDHDFNSERARRIRGPCRNRGDHRQWVRNCKTPELEQQKAEIEARLAQAPADLPDVHPNIAEHYRTKVIRLAETLAEPDSNGEAREDIRSLIGEVVITPGERRGESHATLRGELIAILDLAAGRPRSPKTEVITNALACPRNQDRYQKPAISMDCGVSAEAVATAALRRLAPRGKYRNSRADRMDKFFASNPGFRSRIAHHIDFPDYSDDELLSIAEVMLHDMATSSALMRARHLSVTSICARPSRCFPMRVRSATRLTARGFARLTVSSPTSTAC